MAPDILERIRDGAHQIDKLREQIAALSELQAVRARLDYTSCGAASDPVSRYASKRERVQRAIDKVIDQYIADMLEITPALLSLSDPRFIAVLTGYYCLGLTLEELAKSLTLSPDHTKKLKGEALRAFEKQYQSSTTANKK